MAQYKSEVLHRAYRRRLRPTNHYALGWLPRWTRLVTALHLARIANLALGFRPLARVVLAVAGLDGHRSIPRFATTSFRTAWARERAHGRTQGEGEPAATSTAVTPSSEPAVTPSSAAGTPTGTAAGRRVVLWPDSFSDAFDPDVPRAMIQVLQDAGYQVIVPAEDACCGLTWISTGQLEGARKRLRPRRELRHGAGALRELRRGGRERPAARPARCGAGDRPAGRRLLLPHPGQRPGERQGHPPLSAPGRSPGVTREARQPGAGGPRPA